MWLVGSCDIPRQELHIRNGAVWNAAGIPYNPTPLTVNVFSFSYAAIRSSITNPVGFAGVFAGIGLSWSAIALLDRNPANSALSLSADMIRLKDFAQATVKGVIGAAISYLDMVDMGYAWRGHFEDLVLGGIAGPHPDFVFANYGDVSLTESKGTKRDPGKVANYVKSEWNRQVLPNQNAVLSGGVAPTEGRVIGVSMAPLTGFQICAALGQFAGGAAGALANLFAIQVSNFLRFFYLLGRLDWVQAITENVPIDRLAVLGEIRQHQRVIRGIGPVYLGRDAYHLPNGWTVQFFIRTECLTLMFERISHQIEEDLPVYETVNLNSVIDDEDRIKKVVVQSRDGTGALFTRGGR